MTAARARWRRFPRLRVGLPLLLAVLSVGTVVSTVRTVVAPALTPLPRWRVPEQLLLPAYTVSAPVDQAAEQTRGFSHGPVRRFVLRGKGGGPSVVLTLVAVRGREAADLLAVVFGGLDRSSGFREPLEERRLMPLGAGAGAGAAGSTTRWQTCLTASGGAAASGDVLRGFVEKQMAADIWQDPLRKWVANLAGEPSSGWECLLVQLRSETTGDQTARLVPLGKEIVAQLLSGRAHEANR